MTRYSKENTALHEVVREGNILPSVVSLLVERGVDINALNGKGQTALDLAIKYNARRVPRYYCGSNYKEEYKKECQVLIELLRGYQGCCRKR